MIFLGSFLYNLLKGVFIYYLLPACCFLLVFPDPSMSQPTCRAEVSTTQIIITGFTRADKTVAITSEVSGRCLKVFADIGDPVPDDSVFAKIDPVFTEIALAANKISQARAEKNFLFYQNQLTRHRELFLSKATSLSRLEEFELKAELSRLNLKELETRQHHLQETRARYTIYAPPNWLITKRNIEPGQWVATGQVTGRAGDFSQLTVPIAVSSEKLQFLQAAVVFPLHIAEGEISGAGMIKRINPAFDQVTRKAGVDIGLTSATMAMINEKRGGLRVKIPITIADPVHSFFIPAAAVREYHEEYWLTRENGEQVSVIVLGSEPGNTGRLRIVSEQISLGDSFICIEEQK